jgi:phage FluMu protein Com
VDERQFFTEKPEQRPARFQCPRCRRTNDYSIRWLRRTKKTQIPPGANERDRALVFLEELEGLPQEDYDE